MIIRSSLSAFIMKRTRVNVWSTFPNRVNVDTAIESKFQAVLDAGMHPIIDQYSQHFPYFPNRADGSLDPREAELRVRIRNMLYRARVRRREVGWQAQNSTKHSYGDASLIPLLPNNGYSMINGNVCFETFSASVPASGYLGGFIYVRLPAKRLYRLIFQISNGSLSQMRWVRDARSDERRFVGTVHQWKNLGAGEYTKDIVALDDTDEWSLWYYGAPHTRVDIIACDEVTPSSLLIKALNPAIEGHYGYAGAIRDEFTWCRVPRWELQEQRRQTMRAIVESLRDEFADYKDIVTRTSNMSDEAQCTGHLPLFQQTFADGVGEGFGAELTNWANVSHEVFSKYPTFALVDLLYREGKYSRACNPYANGYLNSLQCLDQNAPIMPVLWGFDQNDLEVLWMQVEHFLTANRRFAMGMNLNYPYEAVIWRQVYNRIPKAQRPTDIFTFSWNDSNYTRDYLTAFLKPFSDLI